MLELLRIRPILDCALPSTRRSSDMIRFGAGLIFWPLALLTLMALALQFGAWRTTEFKIAGPFAAETNPPRSSLILEVPQGQQAPWWREPLVGDDSPNPLQSLLRLRIDGREMGPPHSSHGTIRTGTTTGFSHWGPNLIFSLPPGAKNGPETTVTLQYVIRPTAWVISALAILSALLGWLAYSDTLRSFAKRRGRQLTTFVIKIPDPIWFGLCRAGVAASASGLLGRLPYSYTLRSFAKRHGRQLTAFVLRIPYLILFGLCWVGVAASAVYVVSSLYASATGWALPTTALIRWSPVAEWAASNEPYFGYLLLMLAGVGTAATWLMSSTALHRPLVDSTEQSMRTLLAWCGFPIAACAFLLCISAMWAGIVRPGDLNFSNLGGLIPFSDAGHYLAAAFDQVRDGVWNAVALRRPLAAGFRSVLLIFGNFSLPFMLILQACLVAGAACFATWAIILWRGVWAGIAFFALTYIYASAFAATTLTEPLGLFWALLSIPFFIKSFRDRSASAALVALAMTTIALMMRMGSMFTIPALLVWLVWQFANGIAARLRIALAASVILFGLLGLNALLLKVYGTSQSLLGSNFSYVVCGLTIGTTWDGCPAKLANEGKALADDEAAKTEQLYSMAWTSFRAKPEIFFNRLADNLETFAADFPNVIWRGYLTTVNEPNWLFRNTLTALCLAGLAYIIARRANFVELAFWALLWASILASAALIYPDDGRRTLAASHPLIVMFFAMGMSSPALTPATVAPPFRLSRYGWIGLTAAALLFLCVPWMTHRFSEGTSVSAAPLEKSGEAFVFGGRRMSGVLVVKDDVPLRNDIPSVHLSEFEGIVRQSSIEEIYQDLIHPILPPLPFAFVFAPRLEKDARTVFLYIVPPEVVERRDVPAWHFNLKRWGYKPGGYGEYWFYVTKAEPWP
jgi:hypothetical protein